MTSIAGGGLTRELGEWWNMPLLDATTLDAGGYVLTYNVESSTNKVDKCGATETPRCINFRSSRDPFDLRETNHGDLTGLQIGAKGIPVFREGWAKVKVANDNAAIVRGDPLVVSSVASQAGKVDLYVETALGATYVGTDVEARFDELARIVGTAEEDVVVGPDSSTPGADKVLTHLTLNKVGRDEA